MSVIQFTVPPLPHYIASGLSLLSAGQRHPSRQNIDVFDLLVVNKGCLYMGEEERSYEVSEGHALVLRPDSYHYAVADCKEDTLYHWVHFQTASSWSIETERCDEHFCMGDDRPGYMPASAFSTWTFSVPVPQFTKVGQPQKLNDTLTELTDLNRSLHISGAKLRQQTLFQEVISLLSASLGMNGPSPQSICAERAASYLREHYKEPFSAKKLGESINFHPVYIARCMQKVFGCSPAAYLQRYRIEQSKLLLLQSNYTVERVAEEVGFNHPAYFTASFTKIEGLSPRKYRQRFAWINH